MILSQNYVQTAVVAAADIGIDEESQSEGKSGKTTSTDVIDIGIDLIGGRLSFNFCGEEYDWWVGVTG